MLNAVEDEADYGYGAAKREYHYEFKLGLRVSPLGVFADYPWLPARPHDVQGLETLVEEYQDNLVGEKGFLDEFRQQQLLTQGVSILTPPRRNMLLLRSLLFRFGLRAVHNLLYLKSRSHSSMRKNVRKEERCGLVTGLT